MYILLTSNSIQIFVSTILFTFHLHRLLLICLCRFIYLHYAPRLFLHRIYIQQGVVLRKHFAAMVAL